MTIVPFRFPDASGHPAWLSITAPRSQTRTELAGAFGPLDGCPSCTLVLREAAAILIAALALALSVPFALAAIGFG